MTCEVVLLKEILVMMVLATPAMGCEAGSPCGALWKRWSESGVLPEISALVSLELAPEAGMDTAGWEDLTVEGADLSGTLGQDGAGGRYFVLMDGRILLVSSEGQAGIVAGSGDELLAIATGLPGWQDALPFLAKPEGAAEWQSYARAWQLEDVQAGFWQEMRAQGLIQVAAATPKEAAALLQTRLGVLPASDGFALLKAANATGHDLMIRWGGTVVPPFGRLGD